MKKWRLSLLLAIAGHGLGHAAEPTVEAGESAGQPQVQTQPHPTAGKNDTPAARDMPVQPGAVNPANGQYYPPAGNGDVINPATGERYIGTSGGYINPNTGEFMPKIR